MEAKLEPGAYVGKAWRIFKKQPWFIMGVLISPSLLSWIMSALGHSRGTLVNLVIVMPLQLVLATVLGVGARLILLKLARGRAAAWEDMWQFNEMAWRYVRFAILLVGMILLCMLPLGAVGITALLSGAGVSAAPWPMLLVTGFAGAAGIVFVLYRTCFASALILDSALGPWEAIKESFQMTEGMGVYLTRLGLLLIGLNLLGLLALVVGLLVTASVSALAAYLLYIDLRDTHAS